MKRKVVLVDYGVGNLLSVSRALDACGGDVCLAGDPAEIVAAERVVLPGVGAFGACMDALRQHALIEPLQTYAESGRPLLGICVGMQMLLDVGHEFGDHQGFGLIPGRVEAIPKTTSQGTPHKIPHIGWNRLLQPNGSSEWRGAILEGLDQAPDVYFVHSFTAVPDDPHHRLADSLYNGRLIAAAIGRDQIFGCQFHPEKSGAVGLSILERFLAL